MSKEVGGMVQSRRVKGPGSGALAPGQRWSARRKRDVVLRLVGPRLTALSRETVATRGTPWLSRPSHLSGGTPRGSCRR